MSITGYESHWQFATGLIGYVLWNLDVYYLCNWVFVTFEYLDSLYVIWSYQLEHCSSNLKIILLSPEYSEQMCRDQFLYFREITWQINESRKTFANAIITIWFVWFHIEVSSLFSNLVAEKDLIVLFIFGFVFISMALIFGAFVINTGKLNKIFTDLSIFLSIHYIDIEEKCPSKTKVKFSILNFCALNHTLIIKIK